MHYCEFAGNRPEDDVHRIYHDYHYGTPITDDNELFGRLILEINQAGLSWELILKREPHFRPARRGGWVFSITCSAGLDK